MEATKSRSKNWLYFFIWFVIIVTMLAMPNLRQWFWLALPGVCTHFAYALNLID